MTVLSEIIAPYISSEFILLGDLNWNVFDPPPSLQLQLDALNLSQIVRAPTRFNTKTMESGSLIDIILTNRPERYTSGVFCQSLSDHCNIACVRKGSTLRNPLVLVFKRFLKKFNEQAFFNDLVVMNWYKIGLIPDVEEAWAYFKFLFSTVLNKHAPRLSPWFSPDLSELIRQKHTLWRRAKTSNNISDRQSYRAIRNKCTQSIRQAKSSYFKNHLTVNGSDP